MKAIIMSVQPQWLQKILIGKKKIEMRKSIPKCNLPIDVYLYCTQKKVNGKNLYIQFDYNQFCDDAWDYPYFDTKPGGAGADYLANGKVVAKFTLNKWQEISENALMDCKVNSKEILDRACLTIQEMIDYWGDKEKLYAWHIDNLMVFDTPKELSEFGLTKASQSWGYVNVETN